MITGISNELEQNVDKINNNIDFLENSPKFTNLSSVDSTNKYQN